MIKIFFRLLLLLIFILFWIYIYTNIGIFSATYWPTSDNNILHNLPDDQFLRQSKNDCSVYSINAVSNIVLWTWINISWDWNKLHHFSFGILPFQLESLIKTNWLKYDIVWYDNDLNTLRWELKNWPIILLVYHKSYQHYFTIIGVDNDKRYIYDSLQDRLDDRSTIDSNWFAPWNLTLTTPELKQKRDQWWKYWFYKHYWIVIYK